MVDESRVTQAGVAETELTTSRVLRNTYALLGMTLVFSAAMAAIAVAMGLSMMVGFVSWLGAFGLMFAVNRASESAWGLAVAFGLTGLLGIASGTTINVYLAQYANAGELVALTLGMTAVIFFALSGYVLVSGRDFSFMGGFLMAGLMVGLLGIVVYFVGSLLGFQLSGFSLALSAFFVLLMCGFILYDTSRIIHGGETNYIRATVMLFSDLWVLFMHLLNLVMALMGEN